MNKISAITKILTCKTRMSSDEISFVSSNKELQKAFKTKPKPLNEYNIPLFEGNQFNVENNFTNSLELFTNENGSRYPSWINNDENLGDDWLLNDSYYPLYHQIYNVLSKQMNIPHLLEIGVRTGYSAIVFAKAINSKCKFTGIDPNIYIKEGLEITKQTINILKKEIPGFESILIQGISSSTNSQSTIRLNGPYDFIHVDGEHTYNGKLIDLLLAKNNLNSNGYVLVDDVMHHSMIQNAISVSIELGWFKKFSTINTLRGLAILQ